MFAELSEEERFPRLSQTGRAFLHRLRQHAAAPIWNVPNGEQLNEEGLTRVRRFAAELASQPLFRSLDEPAWLAEYSSRCQSEVPFYRKRSVSGNSFSEIPTCSRSDLAPRAWDFVPDTEPIDEIVIFSSSGTTGQPTRTPHHPYSAACGVPLIEFALRELHGIEMPRECERVAITNIAAYPGAFTTAIVVSYLEEAGCIRVNLDPSAWRLLEDRERFINEWRGAIWLGDPVAFGVMERLKIDYKPTAIVSSILQLSQGFAERLSSRYGCPVVDLYAMTEAGIVAARTVEGYRVLPHDLFVEILDSEGKRCPTGTCGEITLTGGRNPYLPLLRYRTGDFAALELIDGQRVLTGFSGRELVEYRAGDGRVVHSMELIHLIRRFPVQRYEIKEVDANRYRLEIRGDVERATFEAAVRKLFGDVVVVEYV